MKNVIKFLAILTCNLLFSQTQDSSFSNGLKDGWNETLKEAKNIDIYQAGSPDQQKCAISTTYTPNDNKKHEKEYGRGYRCGVEQATKIIPILQERLQKTIKDKSDYKGQNVNIENVKNPEELNRLRISEISNIRNKGYSINEENARIQAIEIKYSELQQKLDYRLTSEERKIVNLENSEQVRKNQQIEYKNQQINNNLMSYYNAQQEAQLDYNRKMEEQSNALFSNSMNQLQMQMAAANQKELKRRQLVANNFINYNSKTLKDVIEKYKNIPTNNFNLKLSGLYSCYLISNKKYSFLNNNSTTAVTPCLVEVENMKVNNLYLFGKEHMNIINDYLLNNYNLKNGKLELDINTTLVVIEPYYMNNEKLVYSLISNEVGYLSIWTDNKEDEEKIINIQELDKNGNIIREISHSIKYFKSEKLINKNDITKIPVNTNTNLLFFGEPTQTIYGILPLYPKMNKKNSEPITNEEHRLVEIKKYRE